MNRQIFVRQCYRCLCVCVCVCVCWGGGVEMINPQASLDFSRTLCPCPFVWLFLHFTLPFGTFPEEESWPFPRKSQLPQSHATQAINEQLALAKCLNTTVLYGQKNALSSHPVLHNQWNSTRFNTAAHLKAEITTVSSTPSCKLYLSSFWSDHNVVVCGPVEWMMIWGWIQHSKENHLLHLIAADISDHRHWQCTFTWKGFIQNQPVVHSVVTL